MSYINEDSKLRRKDGNKKRQWPNIYVGKSLVLPDRNRDLIFLSD
jgi:hypothetical protein